MKYSLVLFAVGLVASASGAVMERMRSERTSSADLEASASGYTYQSASGHPTSYVQFSSHAAAQPVQVVPLVHYYVAKPQPEPALIQVVEKEAEEEDHEPVKEEIEYANYESEDDGKSAGVGDSEEGGEEEGSEEEGGEEYGSAHHSAHGEKGDKGYESKHAFDKGAKGEHAREQDEGFYKEKGGKKAGHHESAGNYGKHHEQEKGAKGEKFGESKYHKKGQKTTGFHNVYHKDEYKKDHTFYDEADNSGHFKKHGSQEAHHSAAQGAHKKGGKSDAAYHADNYGKKGSHDKGHYATEDEGFSGKKGHEAHHSSFSDYANEGAKNGGAEYGYQNGGEGKY